MPKTLRDPIYGSVTLSDAEVAVLDSVAFQRLRHIHQLGLSHLVYHGAEHSRFGHSVGVLHTVSRAFDSILLNAGARVVWESGAAIRYRSLLRLAGLLHDVGHAPFSHAAESALAGGLTHEQMGRRILLETELGDVVDTAYGDVGISRTDVVDLWAGALPSSARFLSELVSSNLDCDRMDYLLRDSHYAGVAYGRFDQDRLITTLTVAESPEGELRLAVLEGGVYALESLILARYFMFLQVYFHKVRRVLDRILERYVVSRGGYPSDIPAYLALDDASLWAEMRGSGSPWAAMLIRRVHHKEVFHSEPRADAGTTAVYRLLRPQLEEKFGDEVIFDDVTTSTHKFELPYGPLAVSGNPLIVVTESGTRPFHELSQVVASLPASVLWLRIFASAGVYQEVKQAWDQALSRARN